LKFIRKALLPAVIAAGFLGFLGAIGPSVSTVSAAPGDVCKIIDGDDGGAADLFIEEGSTHWYKAYVEDGYVRDDEVDVDLNDFNGGDSDITSLWGDDIPDTDFLNDVPVDEDGNGCGPDDAALYKKAYDANYALIKAWLIEAIDRGENCTGPIGIQPTICDENAFFQHQHPNDDTPGPLLSWQDNDIDCGLTAIEGGTCEIPGYVINLAAASLAESVTDNDELNDEGCTDAGEDAADAMEDAILAGWQGGTIGTSNYIAAQFEDYVQNYEDCDIPGSEAPDGTDGYVLVDVTCDEPGTFDLSFAVDGGGAASIEVICGSDVETGEIFAVPPTVEINPSIANVAHSLVFISLKGDDGEIAFPGTEVMWTTDRCAIESSTVDTELEFDGVIGVGTTGTAAEGLFRGINALNPATAFAVEQSTFATTGPDGASRQQEETNTFMVTGSAATGEVERTISAVILHCDPIHAPGVTPGPAVVTAFVERGDSDIDDDDIDDNISDNDDLVLKTTVTVVGPPAANGVTVTAAPASLACGEKATITVDVKDAIGQPVSDHTFVEAVTNAGGVLAGTGAVAGQAGLVSPISSTVAETFGGKVTFYLLTSTAHVGKYEVVVTTGGGGGVTGQLNPLNGGLTTNLLGGLFTTAPISVQVTVECTVPQAPVVVAQPNPPTGAGPNTGQGIRPPSTGDAGLVSTESNTLVASAALAVVASLVVAGFAVKLVREED